MSCSCSDISYNIYKLKQKQESCKFTLCHATFILMATLMFILSLILCVFDNEMILHFVCFLLRVLCWTDGYERKSLGVFG